MKIILATGKAPRTPWADDAVNDYARRIRRWIPFDEGETGVILRGAGPRARVVVLDERGSDASSEAWAAMIDSAAGESATSLIFAIGGAYGHDDDTRARAWRLVRLGPMVMNHAVARVVTAEQIYRACSIRAGTPYHHGGSA